MLNKRGLTIVEALFATVIIGMCLFTIGLAIYAQFNFINQNREKAIATLAAQEQIEKLRGMPFDNILSLGSSSSFTADGFAYLANASGTTKLESIYGDNNIRRASVSITWTSAGGRTLQKQLVTMIARNGIDRQ